ncbi:MAG: transposase [Dehalococcoidia bacterium]|nr:transposase [Dehalococcoidia bacterium]
MHDEAWPYVATLLPADLEESARNSQALVRCRNVPNATALMRLTLAYAVSDLSLKDVAAWADAMEVAKISGPGLFYRLKEAENWLQQVLASTLQVDVVARPVGLSGSIRIVDATVITGPGSKGTDWRAHVLVDPATGGLRSVEITDCHGGESYSRLSPEPGEILLGDSAYARAKGIAAVRRDSAHVVVRLNLQAIRICTPDCQVLHVPSLAELVPQVGPREWPILVPIPPQGSEHGWKLSKAQGWIPARLVGARTRTGEVIWLLTTLPEEALSAVQALRLYRLRWQVELAFRRLKSLLHVDTLPTRAGPTAKSWLLARFLAAALAQRLAQPAGPISPWGYELHEARLHA